MEGQHVRTRPNSCAPLHQPPLRRRSVCEWRPCLLMSRRGGCETACSALPRSTSGCSSPRRRTEHRCARVPRSLDKLTHFRLCAPSVRRPHSLENRVCDVRGVDLGEVPLTVDHVSELMCGEVGNHFLTKLAPRLLLPSQTLRFQVGRARDPQDEAPTQQMMPAVPTLRPSQRGHLRRGVGRSAHTSDFGPDVANLLRQSWHRDVPRWSQRCTLPVARLHTAIPEAGAAHRAGR